MEARLTALPVEELISRLATRDPVPGGGSAAALAGAMGAALVGMVVELTVGRPGTEEIERELTEIRGEAAAHRAELLRLVEIDAAAYQAVVAARRLPGTTDRERDARRTQVHTATREATQAPMTTAARASDVLDAAARVAPLGNRNAISDVGVAAELAAAAVRAALLNVEINLPHLPADDELITEGLELVATLTRDLEERLAAVRRIVAGGLG